MTNWVIFRNKDAGHRLLNVLEFQFNFKIIATVMWNLLLYEGCSINKLQNSVILLVFQI